MIFKVPWRHNNNIFIELIIRVVLDRLHQWYFKAYRASPRHSVGVIHASADFLTLKLVWLDAELYHIAKPDAGSHYP